MLPFPRKNSQFWINNAIFWPILFNFHRFTFSNWILWWQTKAIWKKLSILLDVKFHEFSFGKIRFLIGFHYSIFGRLQYHFRMEEVLTNDAINPLFVQTYTEMHFLFDRCSAISALSRGICHASITPTISDKENLW